MGDRAVSTALGYVLSLAVITVLLVGVFTAGSAIVEDQTERVIRSELRVLGNRIAADITTIDRLALSSPGGSAQLRRPLPITAAGSNYQITVSHPGGGGPVLLNLTAIDPEVTVTVRVHNETPVDPTNVSGGDILLRYDGGAVVIEDA